MKDCRSGWTLPCSSVERLTILVGLPSQTQSIWNRTWALDNTGWLNCACVQVFEPSVEISTLAILP